MDEATVYQPPKEFVEDKRDSLIDIQLTDSTELWLIQWPFGQPADFDGQQLSLTLNKGRQLGTIEDSTGKSYDVVDVNYQGPEAVVFVPSASETRIAGKISKHVSLINYPEPSELKQRRDIQNPGYSQRSAATSTMSGRRTAQSGRTRSTVTGSAGHPSKKHKRKRDEDQSRPAGPSGQSSGKQSSGVTSSGSKGHSEERTSKKRKER